MKRMRADRHKATRCLAPVVMSTTTPSSIKDVFDDASSLTWKAEAIPVRRANDVLLRSSLPRNQKHSPSTLPLPSTRFRSFAKEITQESSHRMETCSKKRKKSHEEEQNNEASNTDVRLDPQHAKKLEAFLLKGLNKDQRDAVSAPLGASLVHAGPGSGKTRVLAHRVAFLICCLGVPSNRILAVTFTNKATKEMTERVFGLLARCGFGNERPRIGTFHSVCLQLLRTDLAREAGVEFDSIIDTNEAVQLVTAILDSKGSTKTSKKRQPAKTKADARYFLKVISMHKMQQLDGEKGNLPIDSPERFRDEKGVYKKYKEELRRMRKLDFDDLLSETMRLLEQNLRFRRFARSIFQHVLVDEMQDTNKVQYEIVRWLYGRDHDAQMDAFGVARRSVLAVGDCDQGIYAFRGANPENLAWFRRDIPDVREYALTVNYRSSDVIVEAARTLISNSNSRGTAASMSPAGNARNTGKLTVLRPFNAKAQAREVAMQISAKLREGTLKPHDFAVIYRTNREAAVIAFELMRRSVPFRIVGGFNFYDREEIADLLAYLRMIQNPADDLAILRVINKPPRGLGPKSIATIQQEAIASGKSLLDVIRAVCWSPSGEAQDASESNDDVTLGLQKRARKSLGEFLEMVDEVRKKLNELTACELAEFLLEKTEYRAYLKEREKKEKPEASVQSKTDDFSSRETNVDQLLEQMRGFSSVDLLEHDGGEVKYGSDAAAAVSLGDFLRNVALFTGDENMRESNQYAKEKRLVEQKSLLMTSHAAKGLEFDTVFVVSCVEGLFPMRARGEEDEEEHIEEERRVFYVALTRCKRNLFLSAP
eukprot:CAMPEP_0185857412 /NCGR_PEP_ID=MMETSP1354-20130828/29491_1 /TAXON_ID=708628 /ORGANISM="Erythrolobus madagascarensis, Strain CCMP3276" /LENGTH=822 /DNA_ID=CAMNT_0028559683 /DNA_START=1780 /DNA_END=4245 /DNA_ORIENTATION=-